MPVWGKPTEGRGSDVSQPYAIEMGPVESLKAVLARVSEARRAQGIERRRPIETSVLGGESRVFIADTRAGSHSYRFRVCRSRARRRTDFDSRQTSRAILRARARRRPNEKVSFFHP